MPKSSELLDQVNQHIAQNRSVDEFTLRRWKHEAKKMLKNPDLCQEGYVCLGIVASFEQDIPAIHASFQKALSAPGDGSIFLNYVVALDNALACEDAYKIARKQWEVNPVDFVGSIYLRTLRSTGRFIEAQRVLEVLNDDEKNAIITMYGDSNTEENNLVLCQLLDENGITDDDMAARFSVINDVMREHHATLYILSHIDLGPAGYVFTFKIGASIEEAIDLNFKIADMLSEKFDDTFSRVFSFSVKPTEIIRV